MIVKDKVWKLIRAEQLGGLSAQSVKVVIKGQDAEETDTSTTTKRDNRSPSSLDSQDTQAAIVMTGKKDA